MMTIQKSIELNKTAITQMKTLVTHLGKVLSLETKTSHMGCMPHGEFLL
nr:hypothetical protein [uncultured Capnocytophaga sp.]